MTYCLLFDSDGTLVDSEAINTEALADELHLQGIDEDKDVLLSRYRGWQFQSVLTDLGKLHQRKLDQAFEGRFRARASDYFDERLEPIAHIDSALRQLHQIKCVASNAPMIKLRQVLGKTGLTGFFNDKLFSAYDISRFKPDPALFIHAASEMGFEPSRCIVIEDSDVGVRAAISAGMKCVHYVPYEATSIISQESGVRTITDMRELPKAVGELEVHS